MVNQRIKKIRKLKRQQQAAALKLEGSAKKRRKNSESNSSSLQLVAETDLAPKEKSSTEESRSQGRFDFGTTSTHVSKPARRAFYRPSWSKIVPEEPNDEAGVISVFKTSTEMFSIASWIFSADLFPFPVMDDDHCESPLEAYRDIVCLLDCAGKPKESLCIYDPYYCDGAVARNLQGLGFPKVYNRKEDCYAVWNDPARCPTFDCLVTNPPYSADHIEKLIAHVTSPSFGDRPWFLLLPNWVHKKDYFSNSTAHLRPFFLVPRKRYVYLPPKEYRQSKKSDVHKKSSPFVSMWYVYGGTPARNEAWVRAFAQGTEAWELARSRSALRDLRRKKK